MKIGNIELDNNVFLAPMAGVTDVAYREICKEQGCGLSYSEMISSRGLYYGSENTEKLMRTGDEEKVIAVQIFGSEPEIMAESCKFFNDREDICLIDINMGCPAPKIVKNGDGSALMKTPLLAYEIVKAVKKASTKPVTVKFRKGFDENTVNALEFAKVMEEAGADAITVHGRTRQQMYAGKADWDIIAQVKEAVSMPVIGNGDVFHADDARNMLEHTRCDGVMVARGAMGNPWIFKQIHQCLQGEEITYPAPEEKIEVCIKHYKKAIAYDGEDKAVREMRKHIAWYVKGLKNCTEIKNIINCENNADKVISILQEYKQNVGIE